MNDIVQVLRKTNSGKQIVMFPFGGGSGFSYFGLINAIDTDVEIVVINPPGHMMNTDRPLESIDAMVYLYKKELNPFLKEETVLFGHSIGGIVSYEICKELEKERKIKRLIVSSVNPPHMTMDAVDLRSDMDTETLVKKSAQLGGIPQIFQEDSQIVEMFVGGLRADLKALERYKPGPPCGRLNTSAVVLYSDADYIVEVGKLKKWELYMECREFVRFRGDHFYLFQDRNRESVGKILTRYISI
jgi:external thioesterase TEII